MPDGTWIIDSGRGRKALDGAALAAGLRLRVQTLGPPGLEEGRGSRLGGLLTLLPVWPEGSVRRFQTWMAPLARQLDGLAQPWPRWTRRSARAAGTPDRADGAKRSNGVAWRCGCAIRTKWSLSVMSGPGDDVQSVCPCAGTVAAGR